MPIQIYIEVNGRPVETVHIARTTPGKELPHVETADYLVVCKPARTATSHTSRHYDPDLPSWTEWEDKGIPFTHNPGEGLTVCVEKALAAVNNKRS